MNIDYAEVWRKILHYLEQRITPDSFNTWFSPLKLLESKDGILNVGVPNRFFYEFLETHYGKLIAEAIDVVAQGKVKIAYNILREEEMASGPVIEDEESLEGIELVEEQNDVKARINARYTFDNFIEGDSNAFAKAAALAVAEQPGKTPFNPLFISGPTGLGKTHLLQAVGNFALANKKTHRVIFVTSEKFMNDFIYAIKTYKTTDFSRFYRSVDMLLLDDIQFFQGKERTQLEFFHTFNSLYQAGKQIVLTSDRPHKELDDFDKRLISRIGWGLATDIQPPDFETRLAILQKRADREGIFLPDSVADFLAENVKDNIRDLESALITLLAHSSISGSDISLSTAQNVLRDLIDEIVPVISIETIQKAVATDFSISVDLLIARNRKKEIAHARQIAMHLCTELTDSSLQSIGLHFGNRDHSTVIHARDTVGKELETNPELAERMVNIKAKLGVRESR